MANNNPLITVLIPCYNAMPYLPEALESIINQTYKNLEILCINDGSTDNTGEMLEEYAKKDKRIRVIHNEENLKLIKTLNKGIGLAKGEYIARMDADDVALPARIEDQLNLITDTSADLISCSRIIIDETGVGKDIVTPKAFSAKGCVFFTFFGPPLLHPGVLCKASVLKNNIYLDKPDALHTEDYELWARLVRKSYSLMNTEKVLMKYRISSQSVSNKHETLQNANFVNCAFYHYKDYFNTTLTHSELKVMVNRIDKSVKPKEYIQGFMLVAKTKKLFIDGQPPLTSKEKSEIKAITLEQQIDILIQGIKRGRVLVKLIALKVFPIFLFKAVFNKRVRNYIFAKI